VEYDLKVWQTISETPVYVIYIYIHIYIQSVQIFMAYYLLTSISSLYYFFFLFYHNSEFCSFHFLNMKYLYQMRISNVNFFSVTCDRKEICKYLSIDVFNVICLDHLINIDFIYKFIYLLNLQLTLLLLIN